MIVLDEQLLDPGLETGIAAWYGGRVANIVELLPGRAIRDEAIPSLLRRARRPTFVTINVTDFWEIAPADTRYCIVCFALPQNGRHNVPRLLRELLALDAFDTKAKRMGKVILATEARVRYRQFPTDRIHDVLWRA